MKSAIVNLWILFIPAYAIMWIAMIIVNKGREQPIEDPELTNKSDNKQLLLGFAPQMLLIIASLFVPIAISQHLSLGLVLFALGFFTSTMSILSFNYSAEGLNEKGIYKFSRNPMYLGSFIMIVGLNLTGQTFSSGGIVFVISSLVWCICTHLFVLKEEKFLENKYGNSYLEYKIKVRRYL